MEGGVEWQEKSFEKPQDDRLNAASQKTTVAAILANEDLSKLLWNLFLMKNTKFF